LQTFVTQGGLSGISVGIQYFGLSQSGTCQEYCNTDADCGLYGPCDFGYCDYCDPSGDSCDPADYAKAEVEIAPLPGVAPSIISSMAGHMPLTATPTEPALQGAINHAKAWQQGHPGHVVIAVLATDGLPTECGVASSDPFDTGAIAASVAGIAQQGVSAGIKTFAIGVFASADTPDGPNLLNQVAAAGGTGQAFNVSTSQNVNQQFLQALNMIRGAALGCQYDIPVPQSGMPDYTEVNVQYTPGGGGAPQTFDHYQDKAHCPAGGDGWYYDDNTHPTQILLCDPTCTKVGMDSMGEVDVVLGCATKLPG
jgi:hypothetical protein